MAKAKKPKSKRQRLIEASMKTLDYGVLDFLWHVPMSSPFGEYADRFPRSKAKPEDIEASLAKLAAEGLIELEHGKEWDTYTITTKGKEYRRLEIDASILFFTNETSLDD